MSKRRYCSTKVKFLDWGQLKRSTEGQKIIFAIDVAKTEFFGALMNEAKEVIVTMKWQHPSETGQVIQHLCHDLSCSQLHMVMEPSGTYGDPLLYRFEQAGIDVYRVSPKKTYDAKEIYDGVPSLHDAKSAYVLGRLHLEGNSGRWQPLSNQRRQLNALIGLLETYRSSYQRNLNRLEARLARHWPEVLGLLKLDSVTLEALLIEYGSPSKLAGDPDGAMNLMTRVGRSGLRATKKHKVLDASHTLGVPCIEAEREALRALAIELRRLRLLVNQSQRSIHPASGEEPGIASMSRVVGKLTAAVLFAKLGDPADYASATGYVKAMGLNLKEKSSGKFKGRLKITKRGASIARMYLYYGAMRWVKSDPVVRAWYEEKVRRDGGKIKMKALIAIMRKLAKALWHVGQGKPFDSSRLFDRRVLGLAKPIETQKAA
jgi:transposase